MNATQAQNEIQRLTNKLRDAEKALAKEAAKVAALKQANEQSKHIAALAIAAVIEQGHELTKPFIKELDRYIAHELPDELWEELNEAAKKIEREAK